MTHNESHASLQHVVNSLSPPTLYDILVGSLMPGKDESVTDLNKEERE